MHSSLSCFVQFNYIYLIFVGPMAKKCVLLRNKKREIVVARQLELRKELKAKAVNEKLGDDERIAARTRLQKLDRNGASIRVRARCQVTGRSRGVYRKFGLSRIQFREMAHKGLIPGVTKASW